MDSQPLRVVLVDDSDEFRLLVRMRLRLSGKFSIVGEGSTGRDAVDLARRLGPQLLVLDVSMPDMDGLEALPAVLAASPTTRVVMLSGFDEPDVERRALQLGAADYIRKSIPIAELPTRLAGGPEKLPNGRSPHAGDAAGAGSGAAGVPQQQADHFRLVFEQADSGMATLTLAGRIVRANRPLAALLGVEPGELVGRGLLDLVDDEHRSDLDASLSSAARGTPSTRIEHRLAENKSRWLSSTLTLVRDQGGAPLYLFLQTQDVGVQRRTERELRQSEERFRLLVETVRDYAIFMLDPTGRIASWNAGAERIKGFSSSDVMGRHFRMFYTAEDRQARHPEHELEVATATGRYEDEGWRLRKDGTRFWANVILTALRDDGGNLVGFAKVTRDVTERERLMLARRQAAQAGELLAVIAHELRNPVGIMMGAAQTLSEYSDQLLPEERGELLAALGDSGGRIRRLLDDLLTASRLEAGALEVRPVDVPVRQLLTEVLGQANRWVKGEVTLEMQSIPDDLTMSADPDRLQQVVYNLITNAARHGRSPMRVLVSADDIWVRVAVVDGGPGVPPELEDTMFDRFATGDHTRGTGLGLFIVREIARAHGGNASYARTNDQSVFAVLFPRRRERVT